MNLFLRSLLRGVSLALWNSKWMSASAYNYERCPLTGGKKCRVFVRKLPRPHFGVRLREVSVSEGSTQEWMKFAWRFYEYSLGAKEIIVCLVIRLIFIYVLTPVARKWRWIIMHVVGTVARENLICTPDVTCERCATTWTRYTAGAMHADEVDELEISPNFGKSHLPLFV